MPEDAEIHDPLDDSPILEEVLGEALPRLRKFHVKLFTEGEPRGLIPVGAAHPEFGGHRAVHPTRDRQDERIDRRCRQWRGIPGYCGCGLHAGTSLHVDRTYGASCGVAA